MYTVSPCTTAWLMRGPTLNRSMVTWSDSSVRYVLRGVEVCGAAIASAHDDADAFAGARLVPLRKQGRKCRRTARFRDDRRFAPQSALCGSDVVVGDEHDAID